ncbi:MAG: glycogen synthase [Bacilli bacterium]|nr:glycogen synthase [Bacilli bacterium]
MSNIEKEMKKITFVTSECQPFIASGGLGDVTGSLPQRIVKAGKGEYQLNVILPYYSKINPVYRNKLVYVGQITVNLAWRKQYCGIFKYEDKYVTYYFIDNEYYFKRDNLYGYFDDGERFAYFSKAAIEVMLHLNMVPDIIHVHDWQAGLVPIYLRTLYFGDIRLMNVKTVFTIHNIEYQGQYSFDDDIIEDVFGISLNDSYIFEYHNSINIMKGAMEAANYVTTVSPSYAEEILTPEYAHNLEDETRRIKEENKLIGILNGIDKNFYNPAKDKALFVTYDRHDFTNKKLNKIELQRMLNLPTDENIPMIGMVTRLVSHKGLEFIKSAFDELMTLPIQLVILGTGDPYYEGYLKDMEVKYNHKVRTIIAFNQDLSRKIYGASDLFLMPSKSEPCGLSQMIAARYGAIPMVRETGGLRDSIIDFSKPNGIGYTFEGMDYHAMLDMIKRAVNDYNNKEEWIKKVSATMNADFGWSASAKKYLAMYQAILKNK